jgi:hypothetical protein
MQSNLNIQKRNLNSEENILNKIGNSVQERQFRVIARQQKSKGRVVLVFTAKKEKKLPFHWLRNQR